MRRIGLMRHIGLMRPYEIINRNAHAKGPGPGAALKKKIEGIKYLIGT